MRTTPLIVDLDYDELEQAVRWRHPHAWNRSEVQQVKVWLLQDALATKTIKVAKQNVICCRSQLPKRFAAIKEESEPGKEFECVV